MEMQPWRYQMDGFELRLHFDRSNCGENTSDEIIVKIIGLFDK